MMFVAATVILFVSFSSSLLLHVGRNQLMWFGHLIRTPPGPLRGFTGTSNWEETQDTLAWERLGITQNELVRGKSGSACWVCCTGDPTPDEADDNGWVDV